MFNGHIPENLFTFSNLTKQILQ